MPPSASGPGSRTVLWFRRDLRVQDHPALVRAAADGAHVVPLFVLDPALLEPAGEPRRAWLARSLAALDATLQSSGGHLVVRTGKPEDVVPEVAREAGAEQVFVTADAGPYGRARDARVARALEDGGRRLRAVGSPYAVGPGSLLTGGGTPYQVFTPFSRAWLEHGWPEPAGRPRPHWADAAGDGTGISVPDQSLGGVEPGEAAARRRWREFLEDGLADYADRRDRPDLFGTSQLSAALKFGEIHPRTLLHDLREVSSRRPTLAAGAEAFRAELCWREFYADVLWHRPETAREYLRPQYARMRYDEPGAAFEAWTQGRTGFPLVDAGMRQLLADAWMHNRVRMLVASFLVKDLHVEWQHGARWFMQHLRDGDLASNQHGWQWVAGCGTDAAPYFRVFNPVTQGKKFDPDGAYVRRYVPELAHLPGGAAHEPWKHPEGYAHGYPEPVVDHGAERVEALSRYDEVR
ncbi:cryptochrome/photolyase family protein [Spongisporangium articulatum]|uniref:Cryptochrome/photolyase family protein n=1 Tax=Spongisporangium articulatum TaxID=3362603 RepID=A0ABW8AGW5_9ACTN